MTKYIIQIPSESAASFQSFWKDIRIAEGLDGGVDLGDPIAADNFDGGAVAAWIISATPMINHIISSAFSFLVATRGEIEITSGDRSIKFKNIKPSQLKEFLDVVNKNV